MTVSDDHRIFSYAQRDGKDVALRLQRSLGESGFDACPDDRPIRGGAIWSTEIEHEIDTRQVMIALLSPGSYPSEICRAEQLRALDRGKRLIQVLAIKGEAARFFHE